MALRTGCALRMLGCALAATAVASSADAAMIMTLDINSASSTFVGEGAFGVDATGTVTITEDADTTLVGVGVDGVWSVPTSALESLMGTIELVNGVVVGGSFQVTLMDGSIYSAVVTNSSGDANTQAGQGFQTDGLTNTGMFSSLPANSFAGIDVTEFSLPGGVIGSFLHFAFSPNAQGVDVGSDLELYITSIPAPGAGALLAFGLFATRRRR